jgi:Tfp pilus assembly protein FimT
VGIVVLAIIAAIVLLALTGWVAGRRRSHAHHDETMARIRAANSALARAHAADEGWDRAALEAAARDAARSRGFRDADALELVLVSVDDRPGVDEDRAVFALVDGDRRTELVLGRRGGAWRAEDA